MKNLTILLCLWLIAGQVFGQRKPESWEPVIITPTPHDPNFKSRLKTTEVKSFYKSKADWQHIIDSTWGPGLPLEEKLRIFDTFTDSLTRKFDGFKSLGINETEWDSIKSAYRLKINESSSKGAFAALMGHLVYDFRDCHTYAHDTIVLYTPLNPGTPILVIGALEVDHFGAVLTILHDSSLLVLRTVDNHPLDLLPGDIVLGYEGVEWNVLVDELLNSGIPILFSQRGAKSSSRYGELVSAGMNWHLFDTIDIIKYVNGDTAHLPTSLLLDLPIKTGSIFSGGENLMWNNEQLPVPGIPFIDPEKMYKESVTYGIIEGTNIGYIYMYIESWFKGWAGLPYTTDDQFYEALSSLMETEGLIIDIRLNYGGFAYYKQAEELLFNQYLLTVDDAYRCNQSNFTLCPRKNYEDYAITGKSNSLYDRPMAILIGPSCFSMGDLTAYLLDYHTMAHFFGKPACASLGDNEFIKTFPGWDLRYSKGDVYHVNDPETFLNRREFPVDDTTWFDRDGVAREEDAVVNKAIEWIRNLSHAHDVTVQPVYAKPGDDEITLTTKVENPNSHLLSVYAKITDKDKVPVDSIPLFDDGGHGDASPGDGIWGALWPVPADESIFKASVSTEDTAAGTSRTLPNVVQFTNIGPVVVDKKTYTGSDTIANAGDNIIFKVVLRNNDLTTTVDKIRVKLNSPDTTLAKTSDYYIEYPDIAHGESSTNSSPFLNFKISIADNCPPNTTIPVKVDISSDYYTLWTDTIPFLVHGPSNMKEMNALQARVYPNPAEDRINIEIDNTGEQVTVIELVSVTGTVIYRMEYRNSQDQFAEQIDVSDYARGMYFIRISQGGAVYNGKVVLGR